MTYAESLPRTGYTGCAYRDYQRKHNPAVNWQGINIAAQRNASFQSFPQDYTLLPNVALVVPNQANDMHNGWGPAAVARGDEWLKANLDDYVRWSQIHNSLLIVTWDEDDGLAGNRIPTLFVGPMVRAGVYTEHIDHYRVLRTILAMYCLPGLGHSARSQPIDDIWVQPVR